MKAERTRKQLDNKVREPVTGATGETFSAGRLGEYTVGEDGVVLLGPPFTFNADNIDNFSF